MLQEIGNADEGAGSKTIIFVETKKKVDIVTKSVRRNGWYAVAIHGDKSQQERDYVLKGTWKISFFSLVPVLTFYFLCSEFRARKNSILVATDVAARGLGKLHFSKVFPSKRFSNQGLVTDWF